MNLKISSQKTKPILTKLLLAIFLIAIVVIIIKTMGPSPTGALISRLSLGTEKYLDVDEDGANDIKISVDKLIGSTSMEVTVTKLRDAKSAAEKAAEAEARAAQAAAEEAAEGEPEVEIAEEVEEAVEEKPEAGQNWMLIILAFMVVIILIVVAAQYWLRK